MKNTIIAVVAIIILAVVGYFAWQKFSPTTTAKNNADMTASAGAADQGQTMPENKPEESIGQSAEGRDIMAYHYGTGSDEVLLVGGLHGGYEWNTVLVAKQAMDYLKANPNVIPANVKVTVIPVVNPDGLLKVVGTSTPDFTAANVAASTAVQESGRFNAHTVDLNRNFDCDWQAQGKWQTKTVSGGTSAFSEPESQAIQRYIQAHNPKAVVVWYSSAGGVFASSCHNGVLPETTALTDLYAKASGYKGYETFNFYEITGDMVNWLAKEGIPAISVLLTNHTDTEWTKNQAGITALLAHYAAGPAQTSTSTQSQ